MLRDTWILASHPCWFFFQTTTSQACSFPSAQHWRAAFPEKRGSRLSHYYHYLHCCFRGAPSGFCVFTCLSASYLANACHLSLSLSLPLSLSLSVHPLLASIAIKSEMFPLLMHTNAQRLTGADSMKRGAAEINTYVMKEKGSAKWLANLCLSKAERGLRIDVYI